MATIASIFVDLQANSAGFQRDMSKASEAARSSTARINQSLSKVDKSFGRMTGSVQKTVKSFFSLKGAIGPLVAAAGVGGIGALVSKSLSAADAIGKMSAAAGISTKTLQELRFAFSQQGVETAKVDDSLRRFNRRLGEAKNGSAEFGKAFNRAGVDIGQTTNGALEQALVQLSKMEDASERAATASRLFGEDVGPKLAAALGNGIGAMRSLRQQANELGIVIEKSLIEDAESARSRMDALGNVMSARLTSAVAQVAPQLDSLFSQILEDLPKALTGLERFSQRLGLIDQLSDRAKAAELAQELAKVDERLQGMRNLRETAGPVEDALRFLGLSDLDEAIAQLEQQRGELGRKIGLLRREADPLGRLFVEGAIGLNRFSAAAGAAEQPTSALGLAISDFVVNALELPKASARMQELGQRVSAINDNVVEFRENQVEQTNAMAKQARQAEILADVLRNQGGDAYERVKDQIDLVNTAQRLNIDITSKQGTEWAENFRRLQDAERQMQAFREEQAKASKTSDDLAGSARDLGLRMQSMAEIASESVREIVRDTQSTVTGAFDRLFDGQINSFGDFWDEMINVARRGLANLAGAIAMQKFITPVCCAPVGGGRLA
ncbi:hypothetical protein [Ferruginivarius sediminum]|uniref:Uncharacterized protein n=1 Tax=Ferruginivarius sediminum TaxID=2661937 RepID=A0A369TAQ3_9PROT|nr:hypothetical protein [Ferruginivarius sediminum]RDD61455.1 hypothetical protein DRB17_13350 [Ferruginivarius sediminum]